MSMMVDEADDDLMGNSNRGVKRPVMDQMMGTNNVPRPNKRRKGPIPMELSLQRLVSPPPSPQSSPIHSPRGDDPLSPISSPFIPSPAPHTTAEVLISPPTLMPSPAAITPGWQVSPPSSPASYPRDDLPSYSDPVVNGGKF